MSGAPVVIATNGYGMAVRPVDSGAPVLTVAENGFGMPIVISDLGVPFVVEGLEPYGPELLVNGDFSAGSTSWIVNGADATHIATFSGGTLRYQSDTTSPQLTVSQSNVLVAGETYEVAAITSAYASGSIKTDNFGTANIVSSGLGTVTFTGTASATGSFAFTRNSAGVDITIDSISIREVL